MDELLDIVDAHDTVIGQMYRSDIYKQGENFRVVNAFLINDNRHAWIPRRQTTKTLFPDCLDASVGGHVLAGERYQEAFERELLEELTMHAHEYTYTDAGILTPYIAKVSAFMHVYFIYTCQTPQYNKQDFSESYWIALEDLKAFIERDGRYKPDLLSLVNFVIAYHQ